MTTTPARARVAPLPEPAVGRVVRMIESGFGGYVEPAVLAHQYVLDALDRGEHERFLVWGGPDPLAILYTGSSGTIIPAGLPEAAPDLAPHVDAVGWRVLIGDARLVEPLLGALRRGLLRRRPSSREQRFMVVEQGRVADLEAPDGLRPARSRDVDALTDFACRLHVEDRMGPPIGRTGWSAVRARAADSVLRGASWVVERDGRPVAKLDLSLHSRRRGAQIAGVYVEPGWRDRGLATGAVCAVARRLLGSGSPGVTLHVRADNAPAIVAYRRAGFVDRGAWSLALR